jgi:hypothetical protein
MFGPKFLVIKWEDVGKYLNVQEHEMLQRALTKINVGRVADGKPINEYLVVNKDEPYAQEVYIRILQGEVYKSHEQRGVREP